MKPFHCVLQVRPDELPTPYTFEFQELVVEGLKLPKLETRFQRSFEQASSDLEQLPRFFLEPDGSFVWVQDHDGSRQQLDGSLYDDGQQLLNVELKGTCNREMMDAFLSCLGWPQEEFVFQLVQRGIYLTEAEFRRCFIQP